MNFLLKSMVSLHDGKEMNDFICKFLMKAISQLIVQYKSILHMLTATIVYCS